MLQARQARRLGTRKCEGIQRTGYGLQMLLREVEIEHRVPDLHVAEEELNGPEVRAAFQYVGGVRMAQQVRTSGPFSSSSATWRSGTRCSISTSRRSICKP